MRWDTLFTELARDFDDHSPPSNAPMAGAQQVGTSAMADRDMVMTITRLKATGDSVTLDLRSGRQITLSIRSVGVDWMCGTTPHQPHSQIIVPLQCLVSIVVPEAKEWTAGRSAPTVTLSEALRVWSRHTPELGVICATQEYRGRLRGSGLDYLDLEGLRAGPRGLVRRISLAVIELMTSVE